VHSGAQVSEDKVIIVRKGRGWEPAEFAQINAKSKEMQRENYLVLDSE